MLIEIGFVAFLWWAFGWQYAVVAIFVGLLYVIYSAN